MNVLRWTLQDFEKIEKTHREFARKLDPIQVMALYAGMMDGAEYIEEHILLHKKPALLSMWSEYFLVQMACDYEEHQKELSDG